MHQFTDGKGRTWDIAIHIGAVKRVRDLLNEDMMEVEDARDRARRLAALERLTSDRVHVIDVIFALVKPQADAMTPPVTDVEFGEAIHGEPLRDAHLAYLEEFIRFFTDPHIRQVVRAVIDRYLKVTAEREAGAKGLAEKIAAGDLDELLQLNPPQTSPTQPPPGTSSTSSPESAESAPTSSPGGN